MSNWTDYPDYRAELPWELAFTDLEDLPQEQLDEMAREWTGSVSVPLSDIQ